MRRTFAALAIIGLTVFGYIPPWSYGGIYCGDSSIAFKYQGDSVTTVELFLGLLLPPFIVVSLFLQPPTCKITRD